MEPAWNSEPPDPRPDDHVSDGGATPPEGAPPLASKPHERVSAGPRLCLAHAKSGNPCNAPAQLDSAFCFMHDPAAAEKRLDAHRRGGQERCRPPQVVEPSEPDLPLESIQDAAKVLADTVNRVRNGVLDPRIGNTVGYITSVLIRALESSTLERRLDALEAVVSAQPRQAATAFDRPIPTIHKDVA
jgi:hypothetical protein